MTTTVGAFTAKTGDVNTTKEGWSTMNLVWDANTVNTPIIMNLSINKGWSIQSATLGVTGFPFITDGGTPWEKVNYPERPRLDVGHHGDDWVWTGTFGHQSHFANGSESEVQTSNGRDTKILYIPLPVGAKIQDIKLDVNNTQSGQYEYNMTVGNSATPVWYKSSIGFSKGPLIPTNDIAGMSVGINTVCIDQLDFTSPYKGIVAAGARGNFFVFLRDKESPTGYSPNVLPTMLGFGNPAPDILHCALADFNQDINNELAFSTKDGRIYVLTQDGMGHFIYPTNYMINSTGANSRMESVAFGDVNGDNWGDVVGGYVNGTFYVSTFDNTKDKFNTPYDVKAGTGAMTDVNVVDLNYNGTNDIVGANADRNWWIVNNTGSNKPVTQWETAKPVRSGGSSLTSLAVADLNWDQSPDLISGSVDGSVYVAYPATGTSYPTHMHSLKGGPESMKGVAAGDLDLDGWVDVVGLNADGWLYTFKNNFGNLEDGKKVIQIGQDSTCIALSDLNNDNALDLAIGGTKGVSIYYNNLGPFAQTIGVNDSGILRSEVQKYLDNYQSVPDDYDPYGNLVVDVPLRVYSAYAGSLKFDQVKVTYTYEAKPDIKTALDLYVKANQGNADAKGFVNVPVEFSIDSPGKLLISDIRIHYKETLQAILDFPVGGAEFNTSTTITLLGNSNMDPDCKLDGFTYTWFVDGRALGTGCYLKVNTGRDLGGVGSHSIRLTTKCTLTGEQDSNTIMIHIVLPKEPHLFNQIFLIGGTRCVEGKEIERKVDVGPLDPRDQGNITYSIINGPAGMAIDNHTGDIHWRPTSKDVGVHVISVGVTLWGAQSNATFHITVEKASNPVAVPVCLSWPVIAMVLIVCAAFGIVIAGTEVGIFAIYSFAFLMYTRLKSERVLDNFTRGQVYGHICENPGLHLSELKKRLELPNGTLVYHLKTLEREGLIRSYPNGGKRIFFSTKERVSKEIAHLTKAQRWILQIIRDEPGVSQKKISAETGLSDSTVNRIVHDLRLKGMVKMEKGKSTRWFIVEETCIFLFPVRF
jgi:predicted transcriptional regulator